MKIFVFCVILVLNYIYAQTDGNPPDFGPQTSMGTLENDYINEASGLAASYKNIGILWTHNDSGGENRIFAVDTNGNSRGTYYLNGIVNRDWEDIAVGAGPIEGKSYIYIADIGDNEAQFEIKYIYRLEEPSVSIDQPNSNKIIQNMATISFTYPDANRDAETLLIDPITKDLFVLGKRETKTRLYRLPYPQNTTSIFQAELVAEFKFPFDPEDDTPQNYITGGDISLDGDEIIVKSYSNIYYWYREVGKTIAQTMAITPKIVTYSTEPQGEAICWKNYYDNGYYTLSEENINFGGSTFTIPAVLYYYPRQIISTSVKNEIIQNSFNLGQNFPNPFNPITTIEYTIPNNSNISNHTNGESSESFENNLKDRNDNIKLVVYDIFGREVAVLENKKQQPGNYKVEFDGSKLSSGIYYYSLTLQNFVETKKMVLLK